MTNEQLLLQIGRMVGDTVREAVLESEERMKVYVQETVHTAVQASEERLSKQLQEVDGRLSGAIENLNGHIRY